MKKQKKKESARRNRVYGIRSKMLVRLISLIVVTCTAMTVLAYEDGKHILVKNAKEQLTTQAQAIATILSSEVTNNLQKITMQAMQLNNGVDTFTTNSSDSDETVTDETSYGINAATETEIEKNEQEEKTEVATSDENTEETKTDVATSDENSAQEVLGDISSMMQDKDFVQDMGNQFETALEASSFSDIYFESSDGQAYGSDGSALEDSQYSSDSVATEETVSDSYEVDGERVVKFTSPVTGETGEVIGSVSAVMSVSSLVEKITGLSSDYLVVNGDGELVIHANEDAYGNVQNPLTTEGMSEDLVNVFKNMTAGNVGFGSFCDPATGELRYIAYAPVSGVNWYLGIVFSSSEITSGTSNLQNDLILITVIMLIISIIVVIFAIRPIEKVLKNLSNSLEILASGDFMQEIDEKPSYQTKETNIAQKALNALQGNLKNMLNTIGLMVKEIDSQTERVLGQVQEVENGANIIAESTSMMSEGVDSQTADMIEISKVVEEFGNHIEEIANSIDGVSRKTSDVNDLVAAGNESALELNRSMVKTGDVSSELATKMDKLGTHIKQVNEITNLINQIAEQTNLLALNASIEAARAGEAGKGFAVVAEEIRKLAEEVKVSSDKIDQLVIGISKEADEMAASTDDMQNELSIQVTAVKETLDRYSDIVNNLHEMTENIIVVNNASKDIANQKNDIVNRITNIAEVSTEITSTTEEITAATETSKESVSVVYDQMNDLHESTKQVTEQVAKFKI